MAKFRARARALDLLGRQQIAGIPTAINELFKNAHDAYADNVEVDYFRKERVLVLRDNGLGMTKADFEKRWLTLGTESKFANKKTPPPPVDTDKPLRPIMGEKGIGRLAIASIGNQVLILTKAKRPYEKHRIVAAFINWEIFELPGLDLDDVVVPIREFDDLPGIIELEAMKKEVIDSLNDLTNSDDIEVNKAIKIINSVKEFNISPINLDKKLVGNFSLDGDGCGTHFYISHVDETLNHNIDGDKDSKEATKIEQMLVGFTNTMTPGHPKPQIVAAFRDYRTDDGRYESLIDKDQFFTPEDFEKADHHFSGAFDEYGQFSGVVKIYNEKEYDHKIQWSGNSYKETDCGPFSINFSYVQGKINQSIIDPVNHARLDAKCEKYGGLYIYKDNVRILPYGDSDHDFIDIEKNRTKSFSYYFFSYRRMFGVINITKEGNINLKEKAGREGFIENKAYRQFRDILKNFFVQLAADFFREKGSSVKSEFWKERRLEREKHYKALERRDQLAKVRKEKFITSLNQFFENLSKNKYKVEVDTLLNTTEKKFASVSYIKDPDDASQTLIDCEINARRNIGDYLQHIKVNSPKGFIISKDVQQDFEVYLTEFEKLEFGLINSAYQRIDELVETYSEKLQIQISKRKRLEQAVELISTEAKKAAFQKQKEAHEAVSEISARVKDLASDLMIDLENKIRDIKDRFKHLKVNHTADFDLVEERKHMEEEISREKDRASVLLESVIRQLQGIYWDKDSNNDYITSDQIADAVSEELEELRDRVQADIELSQLGLAVGVIHHEFSSTVNSIRGSIKDLKAWTDVNEKLSGVYNNIRINFEHLDGYLNLFTPLNRRLYRSKEEISPLDIKSFLMDLFGARLERHNIFLKHTQGFLNYRLFGYRSTFYPVYVNLIDNAIHWLNKEQGTDEKVIRLHADESGFYISNNGPGISMKDSERIFDLGFTRKLNGRGMGLHISKEVLQAEKYRIYLVEPRKGSTVSFKIEPFKEGKDE